MTPKTTDHDGNGDVFGLLAGSGIVLVQAAALIPGLIPVLALALVLVLPVALLAALPVVALGIAAGVVAGIPFGIWRLGSWVGGRLRNAAAPTAAGHVTGRFVEVSSPLNTHSH